MACSTRAAVLTGVRQISVEEVPLPSPPDGWVRVRVEACGVCGSDLRYYEGENPWSLHTLGVHRPLPPRMVLGHEIVGVIDAVGRGVRPDRVGERVVLVSFETCGKCAVCQRGEEHLCPDTQHLGHGAGFETWELNPGGYAEHCLAWAHRAVPLPDSISSEDGVFLDGLGVAVHAVSRACRRPGGDMLVLGCGPIGLLCARVGLAQGMASRAFCVDVDPIARGHAARVAGVTALDPQLDRVPEVVLGHEPTGVTAVIDTSGSLEAQEAGVECLAPGGTMVFLAGPAPGLTLDLRALAGERIYTTSANFRYSEFDEALALLADRRVTLDGLVTHRFGLGDVSQALEAMARKRQTAAYKIVIYP